MREGRRLSSSSLDQPLLLGRDSDSDPGSDISVIEMERIDSKQSKKAHDEEEGTFESSSAPTAQVQRVRTRPSREGDLSLDDLFDESKTAKENKSTLLSYELDRMGMGRYQWCVFFLCGLGYFIDLLWAQVFGLIATPLKNETGFGAQKSNIGTLSTAFSVGLTVGAFTWGILVDVVGRKWSFYFTCLCSSIFGLASGAPPTFTGLRVLAAFVGFGVGGNIPIDATITMEVLPTRNRFLLVFLSLFQPVGVLIACGIAYGFVPKYSCGRGDADLASQNIYCDPKDNMGWRYTLYTMGGLTLAVFLCRFLVFRFRESPAFLVNRGDDQRALATVASIAKMNRAPEPLFTTEDFNEIDRRFGVDVESRDLAKAQRVQTYSETLKEALGRLRGVTILFRNKTQARTTIVLWLTYIADFWGFSIAGYYLPQILADRGVENNVPLSETYKDYIAIYAPGIAACLLAGAMIEVPRIGRQGAMIMSSALMAVSMFLYTLVSSQAGSVGLNALEYFMQSFFNSILYAFTAEAFPSAVRGTAAGLTSTLGRIASAVAPLAADQLYGKGGVEAAKNTLYLAGGVTLLCPLALALLPFDTRGVRSY